MDNPKLGEQIEELHALVREAGRSPDAIEVTVCWVRGKEDALKRCRDLGVARAVLVAPATNREELLPRLDRYAELKQHLGSR